MNVGMVGMGKLGTPVALAIESRGHRVVGYDLSPEVAESIQNKDWPYQEEGLPELLANSNICMALSIGEVVARSDIVFCAIQTPHQPQFEGSTRLPDERADFDYTFLKQAVTDIVEASEGEDTTLAVISTCLPSTYEREIKPLLTENIKYAYNPLYIAMGTVVTDYLNPEFVLIGQESEEAATKLAEFYKTIHDKPQVVTDITTAEGIKVSYNTWITAKTVLANAWGEMCHKLGMDFDDMHKAWSLSTDRLISPKYMKAGMSDGGGCHPRDSIALSWLAEEVGMSHNIWEDLMKAREDHIGWFADLVAEAKAEHDLPIILLGKSFKPETNIQTGSPAILLSNVLKEQEIPHQHYENIEGDLQPAIYFIATAHNKYQNYKFPKGSIVYDPFRYLQPQNGVTIISVGKEQKNDKHR